MFHFFGAITNTKGDALPGFCVRLTDSEGSGVPLYSDSNGTPIVNSTGIADTAVVDSNGNVSFYVQSGQYSINVYAADASTLYQTIPDIPMGLDTITTAAGSAVSSRGLVAAIGTPSAGQAAFLTESGYEGMFVFSNANLSTQVAADTGQLNYIAPSTDTTGASGAWVRKVDATIILSTGSSLVGFTHTGTGATSETVQTALRREIWVEQFGAKGDGATDDTTAINNALTAASAINATVRAMANKTYLIAGTITNPGVRIKGEGSSTVFQKSGSGKLFVNSYTLPGSGYALTSAALHATSVTLTTTSDGSHFSADTYAIVFSSDAYDSPALDTQRKGEFVRVKTVASGVLTFYEPLTDTYSTSPKIVPVTLTDGIEYADFACKMDKTVVTVGGANSAMEDRNAITTRFALRPKFSNITIHDSLGAGIALEGCNGASIIRQRCYDFGSATNDTDGSATDGFGGYGYGIIERGLNRGLIADDLYCERIRHGYTCGASFIYIYGRPVGSCISNGTHVGAKVSGWDTHECGSMQRFTNLWSIGALGPGFTIRSHRAVLRDIASIDCLGAAIALYRATTAAAQYCLVDGLYSKGCNWGTDFAGTNWQAEPCILDQGIYNVVQNFYIPDCYGYLFQAYSSSSNPTLRNGRVANLNSNGTANYAILLEVTGADQINISDITLDVSNGNVKDLVYSLASNAGNVPNIHNFRTINGTISGVPFNGFGAGSNFYVNWTGPGYGGFRTNFVLNGTSTISLAGMQGNRAYVGKTASEVLTTATGRSLEGAQLIVISQSSGITITHSSSGNDTFFLKGDANATLTTFQSITFEQRSGQWVEIGRSF